MGSANLEATLKAIVLALSKPTVFWYAKLFTHPSKQEATGDSKGISGVILSGWNVLGQMWDLSLMVEEYGK